MAAKNIISFKDKIFYTSDVSKILEVQQRQLVNWCEKKLLIALQDSRGAGYKREFTLFNLIEAAILKTLYEVGLKNFMLQGILDHIRQSKTIEEILTAKYYPIEHMILQYGITSDGKVVKVDELYESQLKPIDPQPIEDAKISVIKPLTNEKIMISISLPLIIYEVEQKLIELEY